MNILTEDLYFGLTCIKCFSLNISVWKLILSQHIILCFMWHFILSHWCSVTIYLLSSSALLPISLSTILYISLCVGLPEPLYKTKKSSCNAIYQEIIIQSNLSIMPLKRPKAKCLAIIDIYVKDKLIKFFFSFHCI